MSSSRQRLTVAYIARDGEAHLGESLDSVQGLADEILVVDSGSRDNTVALAQSKGARVIAQEWLGFARQRQFTVEQAQHDWILMLDADEVLLPAARTTIAALLKAPLSSSKSSATTQAQAHAYTLHRQNIFRDKIIAHGDWANDWVVRLFDRRHGHFPDALVHERWECESKPQRLAHAPHLRHYSYRDFKALIGKMDHYSDLAAQQVTARPGAIGSPCLHGLSAFLRGYVVKMGFLDGTEGAAIALTNALGAFMKYAKARDYRKTRP